MEWGWVLCTHTWDRACICALCCVHICVMGAPMFWLSMYSSWYGGAAGCSVNIFLNVCVCGCVCV